MRQFRQGGFPMSLLHEIPMLRDIPIFSIASPSHIEQYFNHLTTDRCCFHDGDLIYSSEAPIRIGILLSGKAAIHTQGNEEHALLKTIAQKDIFGIANLYAADTAFPTIIRATEDTEVLFINADAFRDFIEHDPAVLRFYLHFLSTKIVYLNRKIATYTAGSAEKKLAVFLSENHSNGHYRGSMTTLANLLGIGRASLYRAIDKLVALGFLKHNGNELLLCDQSALCTYCQNA